MSYVPEGEEEPPHIRRLRVLVTVRLGDGSEVMRLHDAGTGALVHKTRIERN